MFSSSKETTLKDSQESKKRSSFLTSVTKTVNVTNFINQINIKKDQSELSDENNDSSQNKSYDEKKLNSSVFAKIGTSLSKGLSTVKMSAKIDQSETSDESNDISQNEANDGTKLNSSSVFAKIGTSMSKGLNSAVILVKDSIPPINLKYSKENKSEDDFIKDELHPSDLMEKTPTDQHSLDDNLVDVEVNDTKIVKDHVESDQKSKEDVNIFNRMSKSVSSSLTSFSSAVVAIKDNLTPMNESMKENTNCDNESVDIFNSNLLDVFKDLGNDVMNIGRRTSENFNLNLKLNKSQVSESNEQKLYQLPLELEDHPIQIGIENNESFEETNDEEYQNHLNFVPLEVNLVRRVSCILEMDPPSPLPTSHNTNTKLLASFQDNSIPSSDDDEDEDGDGLKTISLTNPRRSPAEDAMAGSDADEEDTHYV